MGVVLLTGDWHLRQAELDFDLSHARAADELLPVWAVSADQLAKLSAFAAIEAGTDRTFDEALRWRKEAVRREPIDPEWWVLLGELQLVRGESFEAIASFDRALENNPQSTRGLMGQANALDLVGDQQGARQNLQRALRITISPVARSGIERRLEEIQPGSKP
jgi:Flp pilus assembly protein TadD